MPEKKDIYSSYGQKLISLFVRLFVTGESHSLSELSRLLDCSKQTVLRLVDDIERGLGAEVELTKEGNRNFYRLKKPFQTPSSFTLTEMELDVLYMCQAFAVHLLGKKQFEEATRALLKSQSLLPKEETAHVPRYFGSFRPGSIDYTPHQETLRIIVQAMEEKRICKIIYQAIWEGKSKSFYIMPLKMFSHFDTVYVHARQARPPGKPYQEAVYDPLLAVHRIKAIEITDRFFEFPKDYDFEKAFNREFGIIKGKAFEVEVELKGWTAKYASERVWSPDQKIVKKGKGKIMLTFTSSSDSELMSWLLSFGEEARLKKPDWLIKEVKGKIDLMQKGYVA